MCPFRPPPRCPSRSQRKTDHPTFQHGLARHGTGLPQIRRPSRNLPTHNTEIGNAHWKLPMPSTEIGNARRNPKTPFSSLQPPSRALGDDLPEANFDLTPLPTAPHRLSSGQKTTPPPAPRKPTLHRDNDNAIPPIRSLNQTERGIGATLDLRSRRRVRNGRTFPSWPQSGLKASEGGRSGREDSSTPDR